MSIFHVCLSWARQQPNPAHTSSPMFCQHYGCQLGGKATSLRQMLRSLPTAQLPNTEKLARDQALQHSSAPIIGAHSTATWCWDHLTSCQSFTGGVVVRQLCLVISCSVHQTYSRLEGCCYGRWWESRLPHWSLLSQHPVSLFLLSPGSNHTEHAIILMACGRSEDKEKEELLSDTWNSLKTLSSSLVSPLY